MTSSLSIIIHRHPKQKSYDVFLRAAITGHGHPSPFWKIAKMALLTRVCNSNFLRDKLLLLKCFEIATKLLYPKHVSSSVQVLKTVDNSGWIGLFQKLDSAYFETLKYFEMSVNKASFLDSLTFADSISEMMDQTVALFSILEVNNHVPEL